MTDYTVRDARPDDVPAIQRVADRAWRAAYGDFLTESTIDAAMAEWYDADDLQARIEHEGTCYAVAVSDGHVVGFVTGGPAESDDEVAFLGAIYVDPDAWREGIGSALLGTFETFCRNRAFGRIRFGVLSENESGQSFYRKHGYEAVDDREGDLFGESITEVVFERELA